MCAPFVYARAPRVSRVSRDTTTGRWSGAGCAVASELASRRDGVMAEFGGIATGRPGNFRECGNTPQNKYMPIRVVEMPTVQIQISTLECK